jgi:hypothetical protein
VSKMSSITFCPIPPTKQRHCYRKSSPSSRNPSSPLILALGGETSRMMAMVITSHNCLRTTVLLLDSTINSYVYILLTYRYLNTSLRASILSSSSSVGISGKSGIQELSISGYPVRRRFSSPSWRRRGFGSSLATSTWAASLRSLLRRTLLPIIKSCNFWFCAL